MKIRHVAGKSQGINAWVDDKVSRQLLSLDNDTGTIINPLNEEPLSFSHMHRTSHFFHRDISVTGRKFSVSLVFRVIKFMCIYILSNEPMVFYGTNGIIDVVNSCLGIELNGKNYHPICSLCVQCKLSFHIHIYRLQYSCHSDSC